ncbi:MAG: YraN family protein [Magnetovibrio sp.]|nr:YraN family protein [Magnetovibrio sp.]
MSKPPVDVEAKKNKVKTAQKRRAWKRGHMAEALTRLVLRLKGHRILAKNYKTKVGEIDIITLKSNTIGFVEVKARSTQREAAEAISDRQKARIERAAEHFLKYAPQWQSFDVRFDVALVTGPFGVHILYDAWRP